MYKKIMELIPNRLYFVLNNNWSEDNNQLGDMVINLDDLNDHLKINKHFGPPSIKMIWKHCDEVDMRLERCRKLIFLTNDLNTNLHIEQRTVSAFLMAAYSVLRLEWEPDHTNNVLLQNMPARLAFFRDYHGDSSYKLTILDCMKGLALGCKKHGWLTSYSTTKFPQATNGRLDMNWIVPGHFLAFKDPTLKRDQEARGISKAVLRELKRCDIKVIVRLNSNDHTTNMEYYGFSYNCNEFRQEKFIHYDIPFKDVNVPTIAQANQFVKLCEKHGGKIAVHCHAGLGRTATMIGCHLIKNYGFDSRSVCGWLKMCRRGSVMGPQHFFLDKYGREYEMLDNVFQKTEETKIVAPPKAEILSPLFSRSSIQTRMFRPPRKNNIIHVVPVKSPITRRINSMHKYTIDNSYEQEETKFDKLKTQKSSRVPTNETTKTVLRPSEVTSYSTTKKEKLARTPSQRVTLRAKTTTAINKKTHKQIELKKTATTYRSISAKARGTKTPINGCFTSSRHITKRATKSHHAIGTNILSVHINGSRSWSQWAEKAVSEYSSQNKTKNKRPVKNMYIKSF